ncbi:MAG: hypothetical protein IPI67_13190 [Myxococcales bacterium]|nr:hypothetical protein [Myxococcales bacterium]
MGYCRRIASLVGSVGTLACGHVTIEEQPVPVERPQGWVRTWGGDAKTEASALAVGSDRVWVGGGFAGTTDFDPGPSTLELVGPDAFEPTGYLSWFSLDGTWIGARLSFTPVSIAAEPEGGAYILGMEGTALGNGEVFLQRVGADGQELWTRSWDWAAVVFSGLLTVTPDGGVVTSITYHVLTDIDPGPSESMVDTKGGEDVALVAFAPDGSFRWASTYGGPGDDMGGAVALTPDGGLVVSGTVADPAAPGSFGAHHIWLERLDANGVKLWSREWGGNHSGFAGDVAVDEDGTIYLLESFGIAEGGSAPIDLDPGPGEHSVKVYNSDLFLSGFDALGGFLWAQPILAGALWAGADSVTAAGWCAVVADFDPGPTLEPCVGLFATNIGGSGEYLGSEQRPADSTGHWYYSALRPRDPSSLFVVGTFVEPAKQPNPFGPPFEPIAGQGSFLALAPLY